MNLNRKTWSADEYLNFRAYLKTLEQKEYAIFVKKITPNSNNVLGVKIPILRRIAKEITCGDWREFLALAQDDTFEELILQGMVIGNANADITEIISLIDSFVPKIDNWAVCDCTCLSLKITKIHKKDMLKLIHKYLKSSDEFHQRFSVVMLMTYYMDGEHIDFLLKTFNEINHEKYYVKMSVAWALSVCCVKFPDKTLAYLKSNNLDDFTYNKTIQKITESFRVNEKTKILIKGMKRKSGG